MIGGLGLLGVVTSITLKLKRVHSGLLEVQSFPASGLAEQLDALMSVSSQHDYAVGWLDAMASGKNLGRGVIHTATHLGDGDDPDSPANMKVTQQALPGTFLGALPRTAARHFLRPLIFNSGMRAVNATKYFAGRRRARYRQSHAGFHFLLDYIPNWERAYGRGGLVQYQSFIPRQTALEAWTEILELCRRRGLPSYLAVTKRHRPDPFLVSYGVDGFSLAMDFKVTRSNRARLASMFREFDAIVLAAKGRFYLVKNFDTPHAAIAESIGAGPMETLVLLKKKVDPDSLLLSDLSRRIFRNV